MEEKLYNYRKSYEKAVLSETSVHENPMQQFRTWFFEVQDSNSVDEVNAMTISTVGVDGFPKGRVVLLKKYDENGFYFYTNYNSEKGKAITQNNKVSLSFFWPKMERQILIKGIAEKTSEADSTNYFHSRPKGSQLGAMVSPQSSPVASREILEKNLSELEKEYENKEVPKPKEWGGFLIRPVSIEFWQGRANRLHDRIRYTLKEYDWVIERLAP
ncbi:pyridoxamine 5'-phosphate oxidase [Aequorivita viscosa]|uniref:Pyridoxine/pyridoxamine 5'-phosphate oxidase n=1 Tax=Aequorivita viscosa TaxID=797419 RepID=A0A1M6HWB7_9FLAO|nr:pyridoxamine 5'-phosphate oxidase [Aequorivita viscosa]SDW94167.1 Pyridoxamine 5'-phosphate oxidase [Aequorivita viscosa]SHJ26540.1 Pyridoxamine 5'-phosphate oxidase [Aequorivita viscosa]